jgi:hypothetical protein
MELHNRRAFLVLDDDFQELTVRKSFRITVDRVDSNKSVVQDMNPTNLILIELLKGIIITLVPTKDCDLAMTFISLSLSLSLSLSH